MAKMKPNNVAHSIDDEWATSSQSQKIAQGQKLDKKQLIVYSVDGFLNANREIIG